MRILPPILLIFSALFQYVQPFPFCPPFFCGKLGVLPFPYTNITQNDKCGPFVVKGCELDRPKVQFERGKRKWFEVTEISLGGHINITDTDFQALLEDNSCESFTNFSFPKLPFADPFEISSPNLTLFKCPPNVTVDSSYHNHTGCSPNFTIYYPPPHKHLPSLPGCTTIQLPLNPNSNNHTNIFQLLTPNFSLLAIVEPPCHYCHLHGKCDGKFRGCARDNLGGNDKGLKLELGVGVPAMVIILLSFYTFRRYYKKKKSDFDLAKSHSDPSSQADLEEGSIYFGVPVFSYSELEEATNNFDSEKELGDGGFGTVYFGKLRDGREVAVKRLYEHNYRRHEQFMNEIKILTRLHHKNLVTLYGCTSRRSRELLLVYEYIPNGTVADHLHGDRANSDPLAWPLRLSIAIETAAALAYLHASDIIHRDVKTNNILLDNNFAVKVADFGLSRLFPSDATHVSTAPQGTPGYVDPEYHQCYQLTDKSDVYSFGVVLIELISSMPAVDISRHRHEINLANLAVNKIRNCAFDELVDQHLGYRSDKAVRRTTTSVAELAFQCLQQDKESRPTMDEVLADLRRIESGENEEAKEQQNVDGIGRQQSVPPPSPPYSDEAVLLKNIRLPPSPISVAERWISSDSTTPNVSS